MSSDIGKVSPSAIRWKVSLDLRDEVQHDDWSALPRVPVAESDKYRSIVQRYVHGVAWDDTPLFVNIYRTRLARGETIRGFSSWETLVWSYTHRVDPLYADMRAHGFRLDADPIPVYLAHDGEMLMGNQGNHRVAMAQVLNLPFVLVEIVARHPGRTVPVDIEIVPPPTRPLLPDSARSIPAMTTEEERLCYYRLARRCASAGAVVELGAWLGAATAYLAAGLRDADAPGVVHTYDRFKWKPSSHDKKAGGPLAMSQLEAFNLNMGSLLEHIDAHACEVKHLQWNGGPVSLLVCDAPKRIPEISAALTAFAGSMQAGAVMVWQDFAYFPSYDIPAALIRLSDYLEFEEAVSPGTTAVFRVTRPWPVSAVSTQALAMNRWTADDVVAAWDAWGARLPLAMRPRFACGAAMFLCDIGAVDRAKRHLQAVIAAHGDAVLPKWRYLMDERASLMRRYQPLVEVLATCV